MASTSNQDRAAVPAWAGDPDVTPDTALVDGMRALAATTTWSAADRARAAALAAQWDRRLAHEAQRAGEAALKIRALQVERDALRRDRDRLLNKLQGWKRWFTQAMEARWALRFLERDAPPALLETLAARRAEAASYVAGRLREQDVEKSDR